MDERLKGRKIEPCPESDFKKCFEEDFIVEGVKYPCINCGIVTDYFICGGCGNYLCEICSDSECNYCKQEDERREDSNDA